ncbi:hypothetical protein QVD17_07188 [Tagetes erecta]|uniref:Uncharacterized protein n=1 Tax=Tagetes erecta TaxID=13708 RepID=A0AAD8LPX4_TARER|nr:hypothetical protein QVD17_07188 [Tagetes erecta]
MTVVSPPSSTPKVGHPLVPHHHRQTHHPNQIISPPLYLPHQSILHHRFHLTHRHLHYLTSIHHHYPLLAAHSLSPLSETTLNSSTNQLFIEFATKVTVVDSRFYIVPEVAKPVGMAEALGYGGGQRVLCPVPKVVGLEEPPIVNDFITGLKCNGWVAVMVDAYETRLGDGGGWESGDGGGGAWAGDDGRSGEA